MFRETREIRTILASRPVKSVRGDGGTRKLGKEILDRGDAILGPEWCGSSRCLADRFAVSAATHNHPGQRWGLGNQPVTNTETQGRGSKKGSPSVCTAGTDLEDPGACLNHQGMAVQGDNGAPRRRIIDSPRSEVAVRDEDSAANFAAVGPSPWPRFNGSDPVRNGPGVFVPGDSTIVDGERWGRAGSLWALCQDPQNSECFSTIPTPIRRWAFFSAKTLGGILSAE